MKEFTSMYVASQIQNFLHVTPVRSLHPVEWLARRVLPEETEKLFGLENSVGKTLYRFLGGSPLKDHLRQYSVRKEAWLFAHEVSQELAFVTRYPLSLGSKFQYREQSGLGVDQNMLEEMCSNAFWNGSERLERRGYSVNVEFPVEAADWLLTNVHKALEEDGECKLFEINLSRKGPEYSLFLPEK